MSVKAGDVYATNNFAYLFQVGNDKASWWYTHSPASISRCTERDMQGYADTGHFMFNIADIGRAVKENGLLKEK